MQSSNSAIVDNFSIFRKKRGKLASKGLEKGGKDVDNSAQHVENPAFPVDKPVNNFVIIQ